MKNSSARKQVNFFIGYAATPVKKQSVTLL